MGGRRQVGCMLYSAQFKAFADKFNTREQRVLTVLLALLTTAAIVWGVNYYSAQTHLVPAVGGVYREGMVGGPRYLNPVLAPLNEVDRDISRLLFRGLMKSDADGNIVPDLAANVIESADHKTYDFTLAPGLTWQDGQPLTADDVVFTIHTIQNQNYQSPLKAAWDGVNVEKTEERTARFTLLDPYAGFLENTTVGIMPEHIWQNIAPAGFALAEFNLKPIASGPYRFDTIEKTAAGAIRTMTLVTNERAAAKPYIPTLVLRFYPDEASLIAAFQDNSIDGLNYVPIDKLADAGALKDIALYRFELPRYFAVFFNTQDDALKNLKLREALTLAVNRQKIISDALRGEASAVNSPIPPAALFHTDQNIPRRGYNPEAAKAEIAGLKLKKTPEITLITLNDGPLERIANLIKADWEAVGVKTTVNVLEPLNLKEDAIRQRNYQALLFGQALRRNPDPFSFWHSSQAKDPGLNISQYKNIQVDRLLADARQTFDVSLRTAKYAEFQALVTSDVPAVFLYSPLYLYAVRTNVKGIGVNHASAPEDRFANVSDWYIKTKRVFGK